MKRLITIQDALAITTFISMLWAPFAVAAESVTRTETAASAYKVEPAHTFWSGFGGVVGTDFGLGTLRNSGAGLNARTVDFFSLHALPGYRVGKFLLGVDFDYRWQGQVTSVDTAGGTNLKGHGWLLGVGATYAFSDRFSLQGAFDFLGVYKFTENTSASENDDLRNPIGLRVKAQYFFCPRLPLSADLGIEYLSYSKIRISGTDHGEASQQWSGSIGVSYHFGAAHRFAEM